MIQRLCICDYGQGSELGRDKCRQTLVPLNEGCGKCIELKLSCIFNGDSFFKPKKKIANLYPRYLYYNLRNRSLAAPPATTIESLRLFYHEAMFRGISFCRGVIITSNSIASRHSFYDIMQCILLYESKL